MLFLYRLFCSVFLNTYLCMFYSGGPHALKRTRDLFKFAHHSSRSSFVSADSKCLKFKKKLHNTLEFTIDYQKRIKYIFVRQKYNTYLTIVVFPCFIRTKDEISSS